MNRTDVHFLESENVEITVLVCHVITSLFSVIGIMANLLILWSIKRQKSLQTYLNVSLVNTCVVNIIGCVLLAPLRQIIFGMYINDENTLHRTCHVATFFRTFCEIFQLAMLVVISFERYNAVLFPFEKEGRLKRVVTTIIVSWFVATSYGCISAILLIDSSIYSPCVTVIEEERVHWTSYDSFIILPFGCVAFILILVFYFCIFKALFKQSKKMQAHLKPGKRKVHPIENTLEVSKNGILSPKNEPASKNTNVMKNHLNTTILTVPSVTINHVKTSECYTKSDEALNTKTDEPSVSTENVNLTCDKKCLSANELSKLKPLTCNIGENIPRSASDLVINDNDGRLPQMRKKSTSLVNLNKLKNDSKTKTDKLKVEKPKKAYEIYDAEGNVRIDNTSADSVVGAVCILNPKNREIGKRKLEAKIAKNIAIGIGLFGLLWIQLPLFVIMNHSVAQLQEEQYIVLVVLSTVSLTVYTINPIITIFVNRKIKSECIAILQLLKILRKQ